MYTLIKPFVILNIELLPGELWLPVFDPEYIVKPYYYISNYGRVYSSSRYGGHLRKLIVDEHGYYRVQLRLLDGSGRYFPVHRLVLYAFNYIPGCENLQCNHKDTIKTHNHISNLEWCTCKENIVHAVSTGIFGALADNNPNSNTTDEQVRMVCEYWIDGKSYNEINKLTGVSISNISNIVNGTSRVKISSQYDLQKRLSHPLTKDQMKKVCLYFHNNKNSNKLVKQLMNEALGFANVEINNKTFAAAYHLYRRDTFKEITDKYEY